MHGVKLLLYVVHIQHKNNFFQSSLLVIKMVEIITHYTIRVNPLTYLIIPYYSNKSRFNIIEIKNPPSLERTPLRIVEI